MFVPFTYLLATYRARRLGNPRSPSLLLCCEANASTGQCAQPTAPDHGMACRASPAKHVLTYAAYTPPLLNGGRLWYTRRPHGVVRLPQLFVFPGAAFHSESPQRAVRGVQPAEGYRNHRRGGEREEKKLGGGLDNTRTINSFPLPTYTTGGSSLDISRESEEGWGT